MSDGGSQVVSHSSWPVDVHPSVLKRSHDVPWYVVPVPLMTSTMLTRPVTLRSKPFALP